MHQKDMREFQAWFNKTSVLDKQKRLSLFNYFKGWEDKRDISACIKGSEEVYVAKFMKFVKTGGARTRLAVQVCLDECFILCSRGTCLYWGNYLHSVVTLVIFVSVILHIGTCWSHLRVATL